MNPSLPLPKRETIQTIVQGAYVRIKDLYIPTRDGSELCADVFLPLATQKGAKVAAILSMSPYGKDVHASKWGLPQTEIYAKMNAKITPLGPDAYMEYADPIVWTKDFGYALVRVDCRGVGGTPGLLDAFGLQRSLDLGRDAEGEDLYDSIEWVARQPWCNGKVAMSGVSYLGMAAWLAAQQRPPSLNAIIPWEAGNDFYAQFARPGGIANSNFVAHWWKNCVVPFQHGRAEGVPEEALRGQRVDFAKLVSPEFRTQGVFKLLEGLRGVQKIDIPLYSSGNWMDTELHSPGNIVGYMWASSKDKYLEVHTGDHIGAYYGAEMVEKQRRFLNHFVLQEGAGQFNIPRVDLQIRKGTSTYRRAEEDFPPPDTQYREYHFTSKGGLQLDRPTHSQDEAIAEYDGLTGSRPFETGFLNENFELLGFPYMELEVATTAKDMDIFVTIMNIGLDGQALEFEGNHGEVSNSVTRGYMRLSHRELDASYSTPRIPVLNQRQAHHVNAHERYRIMMPIQPNSMVFEKGHKIHVDLSAHDSRDLLNVMRHEGGDRTGDLFSGKNIFYAGKLVLPFVDRPNK